MTAKEAEALAKAFLVKSGYADEEIQSCTRFVPKPDKTFEKMAAFGLLDPALATKLREGVSATTPEPFWNAVFAGPIGADDQRDVSEVHVFDEGRVVLIVHNRIRAHYDGDAED